MLAEEPGRWERQTRSRGNVAVPCGPNPIYMSGGCVPTRQNSPWASQSCPLKKAVLGDFIKPVFSPTPTACPRPEPVVPNPPRLPSIFAQIKCSWTAVLMGPEGKVACGGSFLTWGHPGSHDLVGEEMM